MGRSFTLRLALAFAGAGVLTASVTAILVNLAFAGEFSGYLTQQQHLQQSQVVTAATDSYRRSGGWNAADLAGATQVAAMTGGSVQIRDASGRLVWDQDSSPTSAGMRDMHRQMGGGGPLGPQQSLPVVVGGETVGTVAIRLPQVGLAPADARFHQGVNGLFLIGGLTGAMVAVLMGIFLARRATAPARELVVAARALAAGNRSMRVSVVGDDEFGQMGQAFNAMAEAIEQEDRLRRNFARSVAHEVRTPLGILRSEIEALQDHLVRPGPAVLASLHEEVMRMGRLIADLESVSYADGALFALEPVPTDVAGLVSEVVAEFAGPYAAAGLRLQSSLSPVEASVDPGRIRQAVSNLLSNSIKFTPEGGLVRVAVARQDRDAVIRVTDTGRGIPKAELPRVFERFFRGQGRGPGGSGIGLNVVQELVRAHGGKVDITSIESQGTTVTIKLPGLPPGSTRTSHALVDAQSAEVPDRLS